jgi:hypothetical protein
LQQDVIARDTETGCGISPQSPHDSGLPVVMKSRHAAAASAHSSDEPFARLEPPGTSAISKRQFSSVFSTIALPRFFAKGSSG